MLALVDGRLSFTVSDGIAFDVPVTALDDVHFAWRDSVMKVTVGGKKYRFYFAQPKGAAPAESIFAFAFADHGPLGLSAQAAMLVQGAKSYRTSRAAGQALKAALRVP